MKFSIITASFNNEHTIADAVSSVSSQQHIALEHIIIDGASTDGTLDLLKELHHDKLHIISEPDSGIYEAFNKGLRIASGDIIGFLNADDFYVNRWVLSAVAHCFEQLESDAVYADLIYVDSKDTGKIKRYWKAGNYKHGDFKRGWMPPHPTLFIKKSKYEELGGFRTDFISAADYELMLRFIHKHRINTAYLPQIIIKMRQGGISNASLSNRLRANKEDQQAWTVNGLKMPLLLPYLKPIRKIPQFFRKAGHIAQLLPQPENA